MVATTGKTITVIYQMLTSLTTILLLFGAAVTFIMLGYLGSTPPNVTFHLVAAWGPLVGLPQLLTFLGVTLLFSVISVRFAVLYPTWYWSYAIVGGVAVVVLVVGAIIANYTENIVRQVLKKAIERSNSVAGMPTATTETSEGEAVESPAIWERRM